MGADLELVEDDVLYVLVEDWNTGEILIRASVNVKKGQKISIETGCEREGTKDGKGFEHYWG